MKKYMVFGFTNLDKFDPNKEPSKEEREQIMNDWRKWMEDMGDLLIDMGSPLINGKSIESSGESELPCSNLAGYMKFYATDFDHAMKLLNQSPLFGNGHAQNYELFECIM